MFGMFCTILVLVSLILLHLMSTAWIEMTLSLKSKKQHQKDKSIERIQKHMLWFRLGVICPSSRTLNLNLPWRQLTCTVILDLSLGLKKARCPVSLVFSCVLDKLHTYQRGMSLLIFLLCLILPDILLLCCLWVNLLVRFQSQIAFCHPLRL